MSDTAAFWEWKNSELEHPEGRAVGGEPCVVCSEPVPPNAHWKQRDRHVCSPRCNRNLVRRFNRRMAKGEVTPPETSQRWGERGGTLFRTVPEADFPYEHWGPAPSVGDVVERGGSLTFYLPFEDDDGQVIEDRALCFHEPTGAFAVVGIDDDGYLSNMVYGRWAPGGGDLLDRDEYFEVDGLRWCWYVEVIRDIAPDGKHYSWNANVCGASPAPTMWTPAYQERSDELNRTSSSHASHARRVRVAGAESERIDPKAIFERDEWICQLCGEPIDPELRGRDRMSASLDHRVPLAAGGLHESANVQASHLICNIRKGARTT